MAGNDVQQWSKGTDQWIVLCAEFLEANKAFRAAMVEAKLGRPGAREAAERWATRVQETEANCMYFVRHRRLRPKEER